MFLSAILFSSLIIISNSALSEINKCNIEDAACVTKTSADLFVQFVSGELGVQASDPLHLDVIEDNLSRGWYKLTNASLYGLKNCQVELMKYIPKDLQYRGHISCPHLRVESECEVKHKPGLPDEKGICTADLFDYHTYFIGDYEKKSDNNGKIYIYLGNTNLDIEAKGKVEYNYEKISDVYNKKDDDKSKGDSEIAKILTQNSTIDAFFKVYLQNINAFLGIVSAEKIFLNIQ